MSSKRFPDPMHRVILWTGIALFLLNAAMIIFPYPAEELASMPFFVPMMHGFTALETSAITFLAFGRNRAKKDPLSYWIGVAFLYFTITNTFYILTWPGLLSNGGAVLGHSTDSPTWIITIGQIILGLLLLTAAASSNPLEQDQDGKKWIRSISLWALVSVIISGLPLVFEGKLPSMVFQGVMYTPLWNSLTGITLLLYCLSAAGFIRRTLRSADRLAGYLAVAMLFLISSAVESFLAGERYALLWYACRIVAVMGGMIIIVGLLWEYVELYQSEREKTRLLAEAVREKEIAEAELRELNASLEERIELTTVQLRAANQDLERRVAVRTAETQEMNRDLQTSRLAALNLLEDTLDSQKRAEEITGRLQASEARYRSLFNSMTEGFALHEIICNGKGEPIDYRFLDVNPAFEQFTGLVREQVVGRTHNEVLPEDNPHWLKEYGAVALTGKAVHFEEYSPVLNQHYEVFSYQPAFNQFAVIFMNVTERKRMEEELQKARSTAERRANELDAVFNSIADGIIVYDSAGKIVSCNQAAVEMLGFDPLDVSIPGMAKTLSTRTIEGQPVDPANVPSSRALHGQTVVGERFIITNSRGNDVKIISSASPIWTGGQITGAVIAWQDVTEHYKAEEMQAWLASFPRLNPNPIVELDAKGLIRYINPAAQELFPDMQAGSRDHAWLAGLERILEDFKNGKKHSFKREVQVGEKDYLQTAQFLAENASTRIYGVEITERKKAEEALRHAHDGLELRVQERTQELSVANTQLQVERQRFNDVLEMLPAYLILLTPDYRATFANRFFKERFGESHGRPCYEFLFGRTEPCETCETYKVLKTGQPLQWEWTGPDGHQYDVHDFPFKDVDGSTLILEMGIDITERKQAEAQVKLQSSAMEAAANGIIITDCEGRIQWSNPAFTHVTGYERDEIIGRNPRFLKSGKHDREFYEKMWQTLLSGEVWRGELVNRRKDGRLYTEEQVITPVRDESGQITHFIAVKQDINDRKLAEEALRLANAYNRSLLESSLDPLVTITPEGKIGDVNSAAEIITGWDRQELIGKDFHGYFSDPEKARQGYRKVFKEGSVRDVELEIRHKDGHATPVLYNASVYRDEAGKVRGVFAMARDISDRKRFEDQLVQAEKHAVIGRMVGSVTHEINNPLQTIKNCLYLIRQDTPTESPTAEPLEMASSETARLTDLVGQLRELYRPRTDLQEHPHEVLDIIEEVHSLLTPHLNNSKVQWIALTGLKRCYINCVRDQILEVFLNISMNAIEAMQAKGGALSVDMCDNDGQVGVVFKDSGPGVSADILPHLFEPFMTTKTSGLGLGLSISYGIIQRHSGQIVVENNPTGGAAFTIWLPVAIKSSEKEKEDNGS
jgi:PAS domain S-box-containing protein